MLSFYKFAQVASKELLYLIDDTSLRDSNLIVK